MVRGAVGNPMATIGGLMITATAVAVMTNALVLQPRPHPAPLFVGTRPAAAADPLVAQPPPLRSSDGSTVGATDHSLIADIQQGLKDFGYYKGEIDGLDGPQTSQAILAFERAFRLTPTGAPSNNVLLAIRSVRPKTSQGEAAAAVDPVTVASLPATSAAPVPRPKPGASPVQTATTEIPETAASSDGIGDLIATTTPASVRTPPAASVAPVATAANSAAPATTAADTNLARIQRSLSQQGFGPVAIDGVMSAETRDAIKRFQAYYGLPQSGAIDEAFVAQLVKVGGL